MCTCNHCTYRHLSNDQFAVCTCGDARYDHLDYYCLFTSTQFIPRKYTYCGKALWASSDYVHRPHFHHTYPFYCIFCDENVK